MQQQFLFSFSFFLLLLHSNKALAQAPAAAPVQAPPTAPVQAPPTAPVQAPPAPPVQAPPAPPAQAPSAQVSTSGGPRDVAKILEKAGHFSVFIRLLKATNENTDLFDELNTTSNGITIFAPSDNAFSGLRAGTLNSLTDGAKIELVKFHVIPGYISLSQFQTVSNPVGTQAGAGDRTVLNVTTTGNSVNITTGITNTSISGIVYNDNELAIYQVDKVLLPLDIFAPKPLAPAPAPALSAPGKPKKEAPEQETPPSLPKDVSGAKSGIPEDAVVTFASVILVSAVFLFEM